MDESAIRIQDAPRPQLNMLAKYAVSGVASSAYEPCSSVSSAASDRDMQGPLRVT